MSSSAPTPVLKGGGYRPRQRSANPYMLPIILLGGVALIGQMFWLQGNKHLFRPFSVDRIKCEHCGTVGVVRSKEDDGILVLCPACYGVGAHWVRRVDDEDLLCPACVGAGRVEDPDGSWRQCRRCEGRGLTREHAWSTKSTEMFKDPPPAGK